ncbi:GAF domain-containing protein, partial [Streptomyces lannensis]|uniref:GAF domain-containing protein n=1 Tax=Streptomyces lannensis TaxID=766498 RepID=UPI0031E6D333
VDDRCFLPGLPGAREFIQLLGQSCQLEIAAVHAATGRDQFAALPSAFLGTPTELDQNDPLVRYCLSEGRLAHVQTTDISAAERSASRYLICAPLMPSNAESVGLLVVEKLPFFALNDDALQLLSVLIGYYADGVQLGHLVGDFVTAVPGCPADLALDMLRLHRIRVEAGIESSLVALVFAN